MVRRRLAGYTLLEIVVSMAVFGIFLMILIALTSEMNSYEKKLPVNFMKHPQVTAVVSRLRKDVLDATLSNTYPTEWPTANPQYTQTSETLILTSLQEDGSLRTVVWDFREEGIVTRRSYNVGVPTDWIARGLPAQMSVDSVEFPGRLYGVRLTAKDKKGRIAIDQIFQPRAHE